MITRTVSTICRDKGKYYLEAERDLWMHGGKRIRDSDGLVTLVYLLPRAMSCICIIIK